MRTFTATSKQRRQRQVQVRFDGGTIRDFLPTFILFFSKGDAGHEPGELLGSGAGGVQMSLEATKQMLVSIRGGRPERSRSVPRIHVRLVSRVSGETGRLSCVISGVWWGHLSKNKRKEDTRVFQKR